MGQLVQSFENVLVVIPARGGSKRILNKNIKFICGQPMIYWPLMELSEFMKAENVLISTDCELIKSAVEQKGLKVPFMRPASLSDDFTGTVPVVTHALKWYEENIKKVDYVLTIYPTSVLLMANDLDKAMKVISDDPKCDSIMSAAKFPVPPQWALFKNSVDYAEMFEPDNFHKRSQDLIEAYYDAAQFYLSRSSAMRKGALLVNSNVKLHLINQSHVVDIDTTEDFQIAEEKLKIYKGATNTLEWSF